MEDLQQHKSKKALIVVLICTLFVLVSFYFFKNKEIVYTSNVDISTAEKIKSLLVTLDDVEGDYFSGSKEEQENLVNAFMDDNSKSNPTYLYIAANTAFKLDKIKEAGFLINAARIRGSFDKERFNLPDIEGENVVSYWRFLEDTIGMKLNSEIVREPKRFNQIASLIEKWKVVPATDAYYPVDQFGSKLKAESEWEQIAEKHKKDIVDNYFNKFKKLLSNSDYSEALNFVNDYNSGKISRSVENEPKYTEYLHVLVKALSENDLRN